MTLRSLQQSLVKGIKWVKDAKKGQSLNNITILRVLGYEIQDRHYLKENGVINYIQHNWQVEKN